MSCPTLAPTVDPTSSSTISISVVTSVVLAGITPPQFRHNENLAFKAALVRTMKSLDNASAVGLVDVEEYRPEVDTPASSQTRRLRNGRQLEELEGEATTNYVRVQFQSQLNSNQGTLADAAGLAYQQELQEAVDDGILESMIHIEGKFTNLTNSSLERDASLRMIRETTRIVHGVQPITPAPTYILSGPTLSSEPGHGTSGGSVAAALVVVLVVLLLVGLCAVAAYVTVATVKSRRTARGSERVIERGQSIDNVATMISSFREGGGDGDFEDGDEDGGGSHLVLRTSETYQIRARDRRIEWDDASRTGSIRWVSGDKHTPRFIRQFAAIDSTRAYDTLPRLSLVSAEAGIGLTWLPSTDNLRENLRSTADALFVKRAAAFRQHADRLRVHWTVGRVEFSVRRDHIFEDAFAQIGDMPADHWRRPFFITFSGEDGLDAGGLSREFFWLCSLEAFGGGMGCFNNSHGVYSLNDDDDEAAAASDNVRPQDRQLIFIGRLLAKAIIEGHHIAAHPSLILLKHMCCEPIALGDLQFVDVELWKSLKTLPKMAPNDIESLDIAFIVDSVRDGKCVTKELCPGGASRIVTSDNVSEFLELRLKRSVFDASRRGLSALLHGFYSVVPLEVLLFLSGRELELTLCGVPEVDVDDWRGSTTYHGVYAELGHQHPVIQQFWRVVQSWTNHQRSVLLQWATGSSSVPCQGFAFLHGRDGALRPFTLTSVELTQARYPRSHTCVLASSSSANVIRRCFNRIDLPLYRSEDELRSALDFVLSNASAHARFSIE